MTEQRIVVTEVLIGKFVEKQLRKVPKHIQEAFYEWVSAVSNEGIKVIRMCPGYHDEPLHGPMSGLRSVRLNRSYRVIYCERLKSITIEVIRVTNHGYLP